MGRSSGQLEQLLKEEIELEKGIYRPEMWMSPKYSKDMYNYFQFDMTAPLLQEVQDP